MLIWFFLFIGGASCFAFTTPYDRRHKVRLKEKAGQAPPINKKGTGTLALEATKLIIGLLASYIIDILYIL